MKRRIPNGNNTVIHEVKSFIVPEPPAPEVEVLDGYMSVPLGVHHIQVVMSHLETPFPNSGVTAWFAHINLDIWKEWVGKGGRVFVDGVYACDLDSSIWKGEG